MQVFLFRQHINQVIFSFLEGEYEGGRSFLYSNPYSYTFPLPTLWLPLPCGWPSS